MKDNYCDITFVLDRSGSMSTVLHDTIGGFNTFIESNRNETGECTFTLVQFDTVYEFVHSAVKIADVPNMTDKTFVPRGGTALLDAIGRSIVATGARLAAMDEADRPSKVMMIIQTDGQENSSVEYSREKIFEMISHQRETYNWEFVFLGANQDAIKAGASLGVSYGKSITYAANSLGTSSAYESLGKMSKSYRSSSSMAAAPDFDDDDRNAQTAAGASPKSSTTHKPTGIAGVHKIVSA